MDYEPLSKLFYKDGSADRFARIDRLALERLESPSTFRSGLSLGDNELFCANPRDLSALMEHVLRLERKVSALLARLPPIAHGSLIRTLVFDEVVASNDIEGIYSTRRQIAEALSDDSTDAQAPVSRRFREFARLYLELSCGHVRRPETPEDIRALYDRVMEGEDLGRSAPDGRLFRKEGVDVVGPGGKVIHRGLEPEKAIVEAMAAMIELVRREDVPELVSTLMAHYVFEAVHPFYDGNGRTGRFLLALYLSEPLSLLTTLSLSRTIAENKNGYYRAFRDAELPMNHGELTFFVTALLEDIHQSQQRLVDEIEEKAAALEDAKSSVQRLEQERTFGEVACSLLFAFARQRLFGWTPELTLQECSDASGLKDQATRKHLRDLEERGLVALTHKRPLRFRLTEAGCGLLQLES